MSARCLQSMQECPRVLDLRLEVGCCAHRFTLFFHVSTCCTSPSRCVSPAHLVLVGVLLQLSNAKFVFLTVNVRLKYTQKEAGGNCRGRSSILSDIMQIVTSAVRVLWPAKVTLVVDLTCLLYKPRQLCHQARPGGCIHRSVMEGLKPAKKCASSW